MATVAATDGVVSSLEGLGNHIYLQKQDMMRDLGIDIATSQIRDELWETTLLVRIKESCKRALDQAQFVLDVELKLRPSTNDSTYLAAVQKSRDKRGPATSDQAIKEDLLDNLWSYCEVARRRLVDTVCRQVIDNFLLLGKDSPLRILCPSFISGMDEDKLETIAGEDGSVKYERERLMAEISGLQEATKKVFGH